MIITHTGSVDLPGFMYNGMSHTCNACDSEPFLDCSDRIKRDIRSEKQIIDDMENKLHMHIEPINF